MKYYHYMIIVSYLSALGVMLLYSKLSQSAKYVEKKLKFDTTTDRNIYNISQHENYRQNVYAKYYRPIRNTVGLNCSKLLNNDRDELEKARTIISSGSNIKSNLLSDINLNNTYSCSTFRNTRGYIQHPLSDEEYEFPIAFSILAYTNIGQVERLLRLIYRPHNYYCIHIDFKMNTCDKETLRKIANCLPNVFIAKESIDVEWGNFTLIEAELACMKTLWPFKAWKYYINLAGQEFPLKTNRQIVSILKILDGANVVEGHDRRESETLQQRIAMKTTPPPHGINLTKGSMHVAVNRFYIDFCLHDTRAHDFLDWLKQTKIPDEVFFSSINHNPHLGIPGSFIGAIVNSCLKPFFLRYVIWKISNKDNCHGLFVRNVCVLGVGDLYRAYNGIELFANKFHMDYEHVALDCLEEVLYDLTWKEYIEDVHIDTSYYKHLLFRKMQLKVTAI